MNENQNIQKMYDFLTTIKDRFSKENILAINLRFYKINPKDEMLQLWIKQNEDYEIIGDNIYRTTKENKIQGMTKIINSLQHHITNAENYIKQYNEEKIRLHEKLLIYKQKLEMLQDVKKELLKNEC